MSGPENYDVEGFVLALYQAILNRPPDPAGFQRHVDALRRGELTRRQMAFDFLSSAEFRMSTGMFLSSIDATTNKSSGVNQDSEKFPASYSGGGAETAKSYLRRIDSGFFRRYYSGETVLDVGYRGLGNPFDGTIVAHAIGIDTDYPNYDGVNLPFADRSVDCVSSSHCLEHITFSHAAVIEWFRVLKIGGFMCCFVPHRDLYEKKKFPPSNFNSDHKTFFSSSTLLALFEEALGPNAFRIRHMEENDFGYDYGREPQQAPTGCYEIELVLEKIQGPTWTPT